MADCLAELRRQRQVAFALMLSGQRLEAAASGTQQSQEQSQQAAACAASQATIQVRRNAHQCRWLGLSRCLCSAERNADLMVWITGGLGGCHSLQCRFLTAAPIPGPLFRQGMAVCWSHEHALYLDLSCSMPGASGEHLWAAASAVLGNSSVRKAGFKLRDQLAALLQHGIQVHHGVPHSVISVHPECNAPSPRSSASIGLSRL